MDHWGDPWADDAVTTNLQTPAKLQIASPRVPSPRLPSTPSWGATKPAVLTGFFDDAQWGSNEEEGEGGNAFDAPWAQTPRGRGASRGALTPPRGDAAEGWEAGEKIEGFGDAWVSAPAKDVVAPKKSEEGLGIAWDAPRAAEDEEDFGAQDSKGGDGKEGNEWSRIEDQVKTDGVDDLAEETSDSATTVQPDETTTRKSLEQTEGVHRDDASTRSSISPSDESHREVAIESPRTSIEDERTSEKPAKPSSEDLGIREDSLAIADEVESAQSPIDDDFGDFEDEVAEESETQGLQTFVQDDSQATREVAGEKDVHSDQATPAASLSTTFSTYNLDSELLAELFPPSKDSVEQNEAPEDPVSSSSTRKAWYRLTRKQTMREFNHGALDDNYVRVTWRTSQIRTDVNKTVSRWANEERQAGRGPGARASFFWDTDAPTNKRASLHVRKQSSVSASNAVPVAQPSSTDAPAAFNWSSPSSAAQPAPSELSTRSVSSPVTGPLKHSAITKLQRKGGRAASVDLTPRPAPPNAHRRTSTTTGIQGAIPPPATTSPIITPPTNPSPIFPGHADPWASSATSSPVLPPPPPANGQSDPWASLSALDTNPPPKQDVAPTATEDDDDEWGEMVESPAVSIAQTPIAELPPPPPLAPQNITPITTPISAIAPSIPSLPPSAGAKQSYPIVRLKGTVSPTSAIFKPNALVPTDTVEKIGPGMLKPRNRSREATPEKARAVPVQMPTMDEVLGQDAAKEKAVTEESITDSVAAISPMGKVDDGRNEDEGKQQGEQEPNTTFPEPSVSNVTLVADTPSPPPPPAQQYQHDDEPSWGESSWDDPQSQPPPPPQPQPDTWGTPDDFSLFESSLPSTTAQPTLPPSSTTSPTDAWSLFDSPAPAPGPAPAPFTRPTPAHPTTPPPKQPLTGATNSAQQRKEDEDAIVTAIVGALGDLGYMLRQ